MLCLDMSGMYTKEGEPVDGNLNKTEVKEVINILEKQLRKRLPKRINNTMLYYHIEEEAFILHFGFQIKITLFNPEIQSLCEKFGIIFNSNQISFIPAEKREEFINDMWMHTVSVFLINLIEGINAEDLTEFKEKLKEMHKW